MKVEAFSEAVILSGDIENLLPVIFIREPLSIDTKPRRFLATTLCLC